jgi:hypothetical protein
VRREPQIPIQRRKRQTAPQRKFQIGRIVERQSVLIGMAQCLTPRPCLALLVYNDIQQCKVGECCLAECHIDALPANRDGERIGDLQPRIAAVTSSP